MPLLVYVSFYKNIATQEETDVIAEENAQKQRPFCVRFFLQKYTQEGACSMHICKFYCLILVHSSYHVLGI